MSFRYTNNLVGALTHRLALEAAHRDIARRTFIGVCNGVEVTCSGYGTVLSIQLVDRATWEPYYNAHAAPSATENAAAPGVDLPKLAQSIQAATWEANRLLQAAKEDAHARSMLFNPRQRAHARLRDWYEFDATSLHPRPADALKQEAATPWMQAVRFGKASPRAYMQQARSAAAANGARRGITVLDAADCEPEAIPIGSTHPLFVPGLLPLERSAEETHAHADDEPASSSRVDARAVLSQQKAEMSREEELFWERVELIRRAQLATIPNGARKRNYADMSSTVVDNVEDKVALHFTQ